MDGSQIYAIFVAIINIPYIYVYIRIRIIYAIYGQPTLHINDQNDVREWLPTIPSAI
jgi:hypothetical protein